MEKAVYSLSMQNLSDKMLLNVLLIEFSDSDDPILAMAEYIGLARYANITQWKNSDRIPARWRPTIFEALNNRCPITAAALDRDEFFKITLNEGGKTHD